MNLAGFVIVLMRLAIKTNNSITVKEDESYGESGFRIPGIKQVFVDHSLFAEDPAV